MSLHDEVTELLDSESIEEAAETIAGAVSDATSTALFTASQHSVTKFGDGRIEVSFPEGTTVVTFEEWTLLTFPDGETAVLNEVHTGSDISITPTSLEVVAP